MSEVAQQNTQKFDYDEYLRRYSRSQKKSTGEPISDHGEIRSMADKTIDIFANAMANLSSRHIDNR